MLNPQHGSSIWLSYRTNRKPADRSNGGNQVCNTVSSIRFSLLARDSICPLAGLSTKTAIAW
jgi:hypothetical protein